MRLFFAGFLMTGLVLIGYSVRERRQSVLRGSGAGTVITSEDGTGFPSPNPTPRPKTN